MPKVTPNIKNCRKSHHPECAMVCAESVKQSIFNGQEWTFIQDSVATNKAKIVHKWVKEQISDVICT